MVFVFDVDFFWALTICWMLSAISCESKEDEQEQTTNKKPVVMVVEPKAVTTVRNEVGKQDTKTTKKVEKPVDKKVEVEDNTPSDPFDIFEMDDGDLNWEK